MKDEWLLDGRKIPDEVVGYLRKRAVHAIREDGHSPEVVAAVFGFSRSCIYEWLNRYDREGYQGLESRKSPGAEPLITSELEVWLKETVLHSTPVDHGYDTVLWTRDLVAALLQKEFGVTLSAVSVGLHLKRLGLTYQKPDYRDVQRDEQEVEYFLRVKFPMIQRLAVRMGADIGFEDEAGLGIMTRAGRTWGLAGHPPEIRVPMQRGGYNAFPVVTPNGEMRYSVTENKIASAHYIEFLNQLLQGRHRPLILLVDHAAFHESKQVHTFVHAHRGQLRIFFLPKRSPELNPDEQVWNEIKNNKLGKQPINSNSDLKKRLYSALRSLQHQTERIRSFFQLQHTKYASVNVR